MTEQIRDISRMLVEFTDGTRGLLTTDDDHEWIVSCVAKQQHGDVWAEGVLQEISDYVDTWTGVYGVTHARSPQELHDHLIAKAEAVKAWIDENQSTITFVEEYGYEDE